jgi:hypothetical protein
VNNTRCVVAKKKIEKNEEIFIDYGEHHIQYSSDSDLESESEEVTFVREDSPDKEFSDSESESEEVTIVGEVNGQIVIW